MAKMPLRTFQCPDDLWHAAQAAAKLDGISASAWVRGVMEAEIASRGGEFTPQVEVLGKPEPGTFRSVWAGAAQAAPLNDLVSAPFSTPAPVVKRGRRKKPSLPGETEERHFHRRSTFVSESGRMGRFTTTWECDCGHRFTSTSTVSQRP